MIGKQLVYVISLWCIVSCLCDNEWYYNNWCGEGLTYLDDEQCQKAFPYNFDRTWQCPIKSTYIKPTKESGYYPDSTPLNEIKVDTKSLELILSPLTAGTEVNLCIILTKRVKSGDAIELYNKYYCAGDNSTSVPHESWSSTKVYAMVNAAGRLRTNESSTSGCTTNKYGLDGSVSGKHGMTPLGDLATVVCSYDTTAGYSSNSLSSYFHDIGWRDRINNLINNKEWINNNNLLSAESLGGNYGESTPSDLGFTIFSADDGKKQKHSWNAGEHIDEPSKGSKVTHFARLSKHANSDTCVADKDPWPTTYANSVASLSAAEMIRRIVLHREVALSNRFPGATWEDIQNVLYGTEESVLFSGLKWGGMTADTGIFLQTALNLTNIVRDDSIVMPDWRIFSKLGAGYSTIRYKGEIISNAYACIPEITKNNQKVLPQLELTLSVRGSVPYDSSLKSVDSVVMTAVQQAIQYIIQEESTMNLK